jgi:hypothetical protein
MPVAGIRPRAFIALAAVTVASAALATRPPTAAASVSLTSVSSDPYTNTSSQHHTQVEPDTFAFGSTIVAAFQEGRFTDGGSSNIGWVSSTDGGQTFAGGSLPAITTNASPSGPFARASDPSVAYDAKHGVWLISSLALDASDTGVAVLVSRSLNGGSTWSNPVTVASVTGTAFFDKDWIVCDDTASSPHYGNCYAQWDDNGDGNRIKMSTSSDGGATWGVPQNTAGNATGLGGQPVVQPGGTVIVPIADAFEGSILAFSSSDGGASWSNPVTVATISEHLAAGGLRTSPLPSAEIDHAGRVYVAWQDCRFRSGCSSNDIVLSSSLDGQTWSPVSRVPIDDVASGVDHFIPGLAVDPSTAGTSARLALTYYYYPVASCDTSPPCQLDVGYLSSADGGASWTAPTQLGGPMQLAWLPSTNQGYMVGDYISTSFALGSAHTVIPIAHAPTSTTFNEAMFASVTSPPPPSPQPVATSAPASPSPTASPSSAPGPAQLAVSAADAVSPPVIGKLSITPLIFRAASTGASVAISAGARVSYMLSQAASTTFTVLRVRRGRRDPGGTCRRYTRHSRSGYHCELYLNVPGSFERPGQAGMNGFRFTGRLHGHTLRPGHYLLSAHPHNPHGVTGRSASARFTIVTRRAPRASTPAAARAS